MRLAFLIALATLSLLNEPVWAEPLSAEDRELAERHYEDGKAAFKAGRLQTALLELQASYDLSHEPLLLADLSLIAEKLGKPKEAVSFGRQFLEAAKQKKSEELPADALAEVAERVRRLTPQPDPPKTRRPVIAPAIAGSMLAVAGLSLVGSLATAIAGASASSELQSRPLTLAEFHEIEQRGRSLNAAAFSTLAIGVAMGGAGAIWLGLAARR